MLRDLVDGQPVGPRDARDALRDELHRLVAGIGAADQGVRQQLPWHEHQRGLLQPMPQPRICLGDGSAQPAWQISCRRLPDLDYGRSVVNITSAAQHAAGRKAPPKGAFEQKNLDKFSFGTGAFGSMGNATYASPSPQAWKLAAVAWMAVERLDGEVSSLKRCWLSLLCTLGVLMLDKRKPTSQAASSSGRPPTAA